MPIYFITKVVYQIGFVVLSLILLFFLIRGHQINSIDPFSIKNKINNGLTFTCGICNATVGNNTKHCGQCDKCVTEFDHHCEWLNNCIGRENYTTFMMLITTYTIHSAYILFLVREISTTTIVIICVYSVRFLITFNMVLWHGYFIYLGIGTYDYILEQREKKKHKIDLKNGKISKHEYKDRM